LAQDHEVAGGMRGARGSFEPTTRRATVANDMTLTTTRTEANNREVETPSLSEFAVQLRQIEGTHAMQAPDDDEMIPLAAAKEANAAIIRAKGEGVRKKVRVVRHKKEDVHESPGNDTEEDTKAREAYAKHLLASMAENPLADEVGQEAGAKPTKKFVKRLVKKKVSLESRDGDEGAQAQRPPAAASSSKGGSSLQRAAGGGSPLLPSAGAITSPTMILPPSPAPAGATTYNDILGDDTAANAFEFLMAPELVDAPGSGAEKVPLTGVEAELYRLSGAEYCVSSGDLTLPKDGLKHQEMPPSPESFAKKEAPRSVSLMEAEEEERLESARAYAAFLAGQRFDYEHSSTDLTLLLGANPPIFRKRLPLPGNAPRWVPGRSALDDFVVARNRCMEKLARDAETGRNNSGTRASSASRRMLSATSAHTNYVSARETASGAEFIPIQQLLEQRVPASGRVPFKKLIFRDETDDARSDD